MQRSHRLARLSTAAAGTTGVGSMQVQFIIVAGPVDFTLRIAASQLERNAVATPVILPPIGAPGVSTRGVSASATNLATTVAQISVLGSVTTTVPSQRMVASAVIAGQGGIDAQPFVLTTPHLIGVSSLAKLGALNVQSTVATTSVVTVGQIGFDPSHGQQAQLGAMIGVNAPGHSTGCAGHSVHQDDERRCRCQPFWYGHQPTHRIARWSQRNGTMWRGRIHHRKDADVRRCHREAGYDQRPNRRRYSREHQRWPSR